MCILLSVVLCIVAFLPTAAHAETYTLSETDITLSVDDTKWLVFTRDNIKDNPQLEQLGLSYDAVNDLLIENDAYMDAVLYHQSGDFAELFVRKKALDTGVANLSNYDDDEVLELAEELAKRQGAEDYSVYKNQYKFAKLEYIDSKLGYYICEYATIVNKDNYTLTFQSTVPFTILEYEEIETIVNSVSFDVDESLKEKKPTPISFYAMILTGVGTVIGGVVGAVIAIANKKKKARKEIDNVSAVDAAEIN